jgi:hypothetical protein
LLCDSVSNYCLVILTYRGARSQEDKDNIKKMAWGTASWKTAWDWRVPQQRIPFLCQQLFHVCSACPPSLLAKHLHHCNC